MIVLAIVKQVQRLDDPKGPPCLRIRFGQRRKLIQLLPGHIAPWCHEKVAIRKQFLLAFHILLLLLAYLIHCIRQYLLHMELVNHLLCVREHPLTREHP